MLLARSSTLRWLNPSNSGPRACPFPLLLWQLAHKLLKCTSPRFALPFSGSFSSQSSTIEIRLLYSSSPNSFLSRFPSDEPEYRISCLLCSRSRLVSQSAIAFDSNAVKKASLKRLLYTKIFITCDLFGGSTCGHKETKLEDFSRSVILDNALIAVI